MPGPGTTVRAAGSNAGEARDVFPTMTDRPVTDPLVVVRRFVLALLVFGLIGAGTELLLIGHFEDPWQLVPLVLIALSLAAILLQATVHAALPIRFLQFAMVLLILAGLSGVVFHYRGNLSFQVDMDPTLSEWQYFKKVIHAKAPPTLAPGALAQLGLLGLVYTFRHPSLG